MYRLENSHRDYAWGSITLIQQLMGLEADGQPLAEVWMGAHPDAPSVALGVSGSVALDQLIADAPKEMLGERVAERFEGRLPYLVKFLAAAKGLSVQVHPSMDQARAGFARENEAGVGLADPARTYRDASHKPEMLFALTPMEVLSGLREPEQAAKLIASLDIAALGGLVVRLRSSCDAEVAMRSAFEWLLAAGQSEWVEQVRVRTRELRAGRHEMNAVHELCDHYPGDPGVLAPLLMNYERIVPGQAIFTGAGSLHAYLKGMALEVMAASDNVLRAGLTPKYIDKAAVLDITDFTPQLANYVPGEAVGDGAREYLCEGADDFALTVVNLGGGEAGAVVAEHTVAADGPRIVVCLDGSVDVATAGVETLVRGESVFIPHAEGPVTVSGNGQAAVVYVP